MIVDRDLEVGGIVMLGELTDVTDNDIPQNNSGAWEVRQTRKTPNIRGNKFLREALL